MKVYSLSGKSGTGKSYHAMELCNQLNIDGIIDDGLFIYKNRVQAGESAKRQPTKVGAVKTALFYRDDNRDKVREKIMEISPKSILVLGTSDKMVDEIVARLGLPPIEVRKHIEDITTEEEREVAHRQRYQMGKHVIPAPTFQVKRDFAGYFVDPLQIFRDMAGMAADKGQNIERTVVRPTYSYLGGYFISDKVIEDIIYNVSMITFGINRVIKIIENNNPEAMIIWVGISVEENAHIWETAMEFQEKIKESIENMTAFNVINIDVEVREIAFGGN